MRNIKKHKYAQWRERVLLDANNKCAICGERAAHAHHKKHWVGNPRLRYNVNNGMALCQAHHGIIHFHNFDHPTNPLDIIVQGIAYHLKNGHSRAEILHNVTTIGKLGLLLHHNNSYWLL